MKKILVFIMSVVCLMSTLVITSSAQGIQSNATNAVANISIDDLTYYSDSRIEFSKTVELGLNSSFSASTNSTQDVNTYRKDTVILIPESAEVANRIMAQLDNQIYLTRTDTSGTVTIYTTMFYSESQIGNYTYYRISKFTGGYTASGLNGTTIIGNYLLCGIMGMTPSGTSIYDSFGTTFATNQTSWTVNMPASWTQVRVWGGGAYGSTYTVTMQRPSGYTWNVSLSNNLWG